MAYLITGANGFVGKALIEKLISDGVSCVGAVRRLNVDSSDRYPVVEVGDIDLNVDWSVALTGVNKVVHTAGRVHFVNDQSLSSLAEYRIVNVEATLNLARQAASAGVERFIFISSIKVNGEQTEIGRPFDEKDLADPKDSYGISKHEAEKGLRLIAESTDMSVTIIRPVLVYGLGVKGNFLSMIDWLRKGIPLPLGAIDNARSLVAIDNLVDFIIVCLEHSAAVNQTFLVSDGDDLSTTQLLKYAAAAMGKRVLLIPVPMFFIKLLARIIRKDQIVQRLCCSLQVDVTKAREILGWTPVISVREGLKRAVDRSR